MIRKKRLAQPEDEIKVVAKQILNEARKRAKHEMNCLTELVLHEAKIVARYSHERPFYIS